MCHSLKNILRKIPGKVLTVILSAVLFPCAALYGSDDTEYEFVNGVIPPTPQAAALARYGEHPVDLSTGLVDISVPVYTVRVGGYELPITLSYHASGIKVSDIATPVGLGWVLNAGGAVSRNICGVDDKITSSPQEYKWRDSLAISGLVEAGDIDALHELSTHFCSTSGYNLQSDRYTYNFAGHSGTMRYNHTEKKFVPLNNDNFLIYTAYNSGDGAFEIIDSGGISYLFDVPGRTGSSDEGVPPVTSWHLSQISTPYGDIQLEYSNAYTYTQRFYSESTLLGGIHRYKELGNYIDYKVETSEPTHTDLYYKEVLLESITWNDGRVDFSYESNRPYIDSFGNTLYLPSLTGITISNSDGVLLNTITLEHTEWGNSNANRRTLLSKVISDSDGEHTFGYNAQTGVYLPSYNEYNDSPCDYWGYYNGNRSQSMLSAEVIDSAVEDYKKRYGIVDFESYNNRFADRDVDEEKAKLGILTSVKYPTGGSTTFSYESHSVLGETYGGLRISGITTTDGSSGSTVRKFEYSGEVYQPHPRELMSYHTPMPYTDITDFQSTDWLTTVTSEYVVPFSSLGCPVFYYEVTETVNDAVSTSTAFSLPRWPLQYPYNYDTDQTHFLPPSMQRFALIDEGTLRSVPVCRTVRDLDTRSVIYEETVKYDTVRVAKFCCGIQVAKPWPLESGHGSIPSASACRKPYFYYSPVYCYVLAVNKVSETKTDHLTGITSATSYTYEPAGYCVDHPRSVQTALSDGRTLCTTYEYAADLTDEMSELLVDRFNLTSAVRGVQTSIGGEVVSTTRIDYSTDNALPLARYTSVADGALAERERVLTFNAYGRPLAVVTECTDTICFGWDNGTALASVTAPGGLVTAYKMSPLFGPVSVTSPSGYKREFGYEEGGRLSAVHDNRGLLESYVYSISQSGKNSVTTSTKINDWGRCVTKVDYFDGLGRPMMCADNTDSYAGKYLYTCMEYDSFGRVSRTSLAAVCDGTPQYLSKAEFEELLPKTYTADKALWSDISYDKLNRQIFSTTPGDDMAAGNRGKAVAYFANGKNDVKLYQAPLGSTSLVKSGYYPKATLLAERATDEDGLSVTTYTDFSGRKVLERRGQDNDTYFVYNDAGQLRFILSPEYQNAGYRDKYAFEYRYDSLGRVVKAITPGCGATQFWYDRGGRTLFIQDGRLRADGCHRFILYDRAGRQCVQGITSRCSRGDSPNPVSLENSMGKMRGYTAADPGRVSVDYVETAAYYDDYAFLSLYGYDLSTDIAASASATGLQTGVWSRLSDGSSMLEVMFYDILGRVVKTRVFGPFGHETETETEYNYADSPLSCSYTEGGISYSINNEYQYENRSLYESTVTLNGHTCKILRNGYDDFGRISTIERENWGGTSHFYYNIRGQLTSITHANDFTQNLYYTDGPGTPRYNGMVSAMSWLTGKGETRVRGYRYTYDSLGRLTEAAYGENSTLTSNPNRYTERVLEYSANGAMKRFQRHGLKDDGVYGKIDNLHIWYDGNRLKKVLDDADAVTRYAAADFPDLSDADTEYTYDECGALTSDLNQGITSITYDYLGYPRLMRFSNGEETEYVYTPSGEKVREIHRAPAAAMAVALTLDTGLSDQLTSVQMTADTTDYIGPVIYRGSEPCMVRYTGGYAAIGSDLTPDFYFYLTDYLGNNRAVVRASTGTLDQITHYYPWGGVYADMGKASSLQPFKYGDKELDLSGDVARYDYTARAYFPALPVMDRPDSNAGTYPHLSPYLFCANNPVNITDPTGNDIVVLKFGGWKHLAMLIQGENGKWQYYSVNGNNVYSSGKHKGGRKFNDIAVGNWDTPTDFFESSYNMRDDHSKDDVNKSNFFYDEGYLIHTTPDQDAIMRGEFKKIAQTEYDLVFNNCATAVQKALVAGGVPISEPTYEPSYLPVSTPYGIIDVFNGYTMKCKDYILPNKAFESIMKWNPDGMYIEYKRMKDDL